MASVAEAQNYRNFIPLLCALSSECHGDRKEGRCAGGLSAADLPLPIRPPSPSATEFADGYSLAKPSSSFGSSTSRAWNLTS